MSKSYISRGFFLREDRGLIEVQGSDRVKFMNGMVTNDVKTLQPGSWISASAVDLKGHLIADLKIYNMGSSLWLDVPAPCLTVVKHSLTKYKVRDDVHFAEISNRWKPLTWVGSSAPFTFDLPDSGTWKDFELLGIQAKIARDPSEGEVFQVFAPQELVTHLQPRLTKEEWQEFRIESGLPLWNVDVNEERLPLEVPYFEKGISFTKGCYLGQETITRVAHRGGHVAWRLMGVVAHSKLDLNGARIELNGKDVGKLTSFTFSRRFDQGLGMGFIHREAFAPDTEVLVVKGEIRLPGRVVSLPI